MRSAQILLDAFGRIRDVVHAVVEGLAPEELSWRIGPEANSIAWLLWHLSRVQDDHVTDVAGTEQIWTSNGWVDRFALPFAAGATGFGHTAEEVAAVRVRSGEILVAYHDDVHAHTERFVAQLGDEDLDRVVDRSWDPPVTLGVRLVSVLEDDLQHAGQAAFVRGVLLAR